MSPTISIAFTDRITGSIDRIDRIESSKRSQPIACCTASRQPIALTFSAPVDPQKSCYPVKKPTGSTPSGGQINAGIRPRNLVEANCPAERAARAGKSEERLSASSAASSEIEPRQRARSAPGDLHRKPSASSPRPSRLEKAQSRPVLEPPMPRTIRKSRPLDELRATKCAPFWNPKACFRDPFHKFQYDKTPTPTDDAPRDRPSRPQPIPPDTSAASWVAHPESAKGVLLFDEATPTPVQVATGASLRRGAPADVSAKNSSSRQWALPAAARSPVAI